MIASWLALVANAQAQEDGQRIRKKERQEEHTAPKGMQPGTNQQARHRAPGAPGRPVPRPSMSETGADQGGASAHRVAADAPSARARHSGFHAQPKPQEFPALEFDENRRVKGSEHWDGEKYAAFRSYHPHRHKRDWYHRHCRRIVLICGGYYYWYNSYWYPAWGYDPSYSYYVYDGPIYSGTRDESVDQIIADVQTTLHDLGYYDGEVDGILGELTRQAIIVYQVDNGLYQTAAIDQPTLASLGLD